MSSAGRHDDGELGWKFKGVVEVVPLQSPAHPRGFGFVDRVEFRHVQFGAAVNMLPVLPIAVAFVRGSERLVATHQLRNDFAKQAA